MQEPPDSLFSKVQQLHSKLLLAQPSRPIEEMYFSHLYLRFYAFSQYPKVMTISDGWKVD